MARIAVYNTREMSRRWLLVSAIALASCRGFLGIDELPGEQADAGEDAEAAAVIDAGSEEEAAPPPPPTYCDKLTPRADYCFDFDKSENILKGWDNANSIPDSLGESGGGAITGDVTRYQPDSPPRSAVLTIPAVAGVGGVSAFLEKTLHATPPEMTIKFDLRIDTEDYPPPGGHLVPLLSLTFGAGADNSLFVVRDGVGTYFAVGSGLVKLDVPPAVGEWTQVTISIQNEPVEGGADGLAIVRINNLDSAHLPIPAAYQGMNEQVMGIGPLLKGPMGKFQMTIDNVRIWPRSDL